MGREEVREECLRILSKDGKVKFEDLDPVSKATWLAFERGFMKSFDFLSEPILEKHVVCESCNAIGISDNDCICTYQNGYPTEELNFARCKVCDVVEDSPIYSDDDDE